MLNEYYVLGFLNGLNYNNAFTEKVEYQLNTAVYKIFSMMSGVNSSQMDSKGIPSDMFGGWKNRTVCHSGLKFTGSRNENLYKELNARVTHVNSFHLKSELVFSFHFFSLYYVLFIV